jgi:hypothetical protein
VVPEVKELTPPKLEVPTIVSEDKVAEPLTASVLDSVTAPVTPSVVPTLREDARVALPPKDRVPPRKTAALTPKPPVTTTAPVEGLEEGVPELKEAIPAYDELAVTVKVEREVAPMTLRLPANIPVPVTCKLFEIPKVPALTLQRRQSLLAPMKKEELSLFKRMRIQLDALWRMWRWEILGARLEPGVPKPDAEWFKVSLAAGSESEAS